MEGSGEVSLADCRERLTSARGLERLRLLNALARELVLKDPQEAAKVVAEAMELGATLPQEQAGPERRVRGERAEALRLRGLLAMHRGEYAEALRHLEAAQEAFAESDHREGPGSCWNNLAAVYRLLDDYGRALNYYEKALSRAREIGDSEAETDTLGNIGDLYHAMGEWFQAEMFVGAAHERAVAEGNAASEMIWANHLAEVHIARDKLGDAHSLLERAHALSEEREETAFRIGIWLNFGKLRTKQRDLPAAYRAYSEAVKLAETFAERRMVIEISLEVGRLLLELTAAESQALGVSAEQILEQALQGARAIGVDSLCRQAHKSLAEYHEKQGAFQRAYRHLHQYGELTHAEKAAETERKLRQQRLLFEVDQTRRELESSRAANQQLRAEVARREEVESHLRDALVQARQADEVKTRFLATMSHEIRTPMNGILGMTDVLSRTQLGADQKEAVQVILQAGHNLLDLINNILDLTKLEAGRVNLVHDDFSPAQVINKVAVRGERESAEKGLGFTFRSDPALDQVFRGDAARWEQLLLILLSNAVKFTASGSVSLKVEAVSAERVRCTVEDTGIGIPEDQRERIFEVFTQLDSSTTRRFGGVGLGLAIARKLAVLMGGSLVAANKEGSGSRLVLELPLRQSGSEDPADPPPLNRAGGRPLRALVVEDTEFNWRVLSLLLEKLGVKAVWVNDGFQALKRVKAEVFDVVLMDVRMPGIDGLETARRIRQDRTLKRQPRIVALSAYSLAHDDERLKAATIDAQLIKPVELSRLREAIVPG